MFSHIVLNDGQWSVGFVLNSNDLMSTDNYQQGVLKQLAKGRRQWLEQGTRQLQQIAWQAQQNVELLQQLQESQKQLQVSRQQLQESQQQLQISQRQFQQHLQKCQDTIHIQPHHEQRCRSCFDNCNISSCIVYLSFCRHC